MRIDPAQSTWDELAAAAAAVEDGAAVTALGGVLLALECTAGGPRWGVDEPLVVLQRRFARAQRRLQATGLGVGELEQHLLALRGAAARAGQPAAAVEADAAVRAVPVPC